MSRVHSGICEMFQFVSIASEYMLLFWKVFLLVKEIYSDILAAEF